MIYTYKIQCTQCQYDFECEVDIETTMTTYPVKCPRCGRQIELSLAKTKQLPSLPKSKTSHYISKTTKPETDESDEKITFRCIPQPPKHERKSKIIRPKQSRQAELDVKPDIPAEDTEPAEDSTPLAAVDFMTCPEPGPYTTPEEAEVEALDKKSRPTARRTRKRRPGASGKAVKEEYIAPGLERIRSDRKPLRWDYQDRSKKMEKRTKRISFLNDSGKRLRLAIFLLIIVFIFGIVHGVFSLSSGSPEPIDSGLSTPDTVDIDGTVIDFNTGRPIPGSEVQLLGTGKKDLTNSDGYYLITNVRVGDQEIRAEAAGYSKIVKIVTVASEQPANFNFELKPGVSTEVFDESVKTVEKPDNDLNVFAIFIIIFACFAILAIFLIWQRNFFQICVFCAFLSIMSFGMGVGLIIGLFALILILLSSSGFTKNKKEELSLVGPGKVVKEKGK
jgi:hypothetical protein